MRTLRALLAGGLLTATSLFGQSMTSISPNYGPSSGGASYVITGSGFSITPKATRFVDINNSDIFTGVTCLPTGTECSGSPRYGLVPAGSVQTFAVFALVNGVKSGSFASFIQYGPPVITSMVPNNAATAAGTSPIVINGGAFTDSPSF